jgi:PHP family Zn ribbon phosphoesterase
MTELQEAKLLEDVALTRQAVMGGDGMKGVVQRVEEIEDWKESHPRVCPYNEPPNPRKVNGLNIFLGIVGAIGVAGSLVVAVIK